MTRSEPFVGRAGAVADLRTWLAAADGGTGALVLVGGPAGIGKTRLAETVTGPAAVWGRCVDEAGEQPDGNGDLTEPRIEDHVFDDVQFPGDRVRGSHPRTPDGGAAHGLDVHPERLLKEDFEDLLGIVGGPHPAPRLGPDNRPAGLRLRRFVGDQAADGFGDPHGFQGAEGTVGVRKEIDIAPGGFGHGGDVFAFAPDVVVAGFGSAEAPPAPVDEVEAIALGEPIPDGGPAGVVGTGAVDEDHRWAVAEGFVADDRPVG